MGVLSLLVIGFIYAAFPLTVLAADSEDRMAGIETRLTNIENNQKDILLRLEKILAELDRLRIWVHRR